MRSMTGYGQGAGENEVLRVAVSARSVNHRYLDLALKLPEDLRSLESGLRAALGERLHRGRVDLRVAVESLAGNDAEVVVDHGLVEQLLAAAAEMSGSRLSDRRLDRADLLQRPEIVRIERRFPHIGDDERALILAAVGEAIDGLIAMREVEGEALRAALQRGVSSLEAFARQLAEARPAVRQRLVDAMRTRLAELVDRRGEIEQDRLAQEVALLAEKIDIQEELDRLIGHLAHFRETMNDDGAIGRRLDFLAQEIHRELNTLGAKCRDLQMAEWVIDSKVACEQLREQVQNVE